MLSMESNEDALNQIWLSHNYYTYVLVDESVVDPAWDEKFDALFEKFVIPQIEHFTQKSIDDFKSSGSELEYWAMPLGDIHLYSKVEFELEPNGNIQYVYIFSIIGFFVLLIACINFMNLSTARSSTRSKEVGIRKVLGSFRQQIILQFLAEAFIITAVSFILSLFLIELLMPVFSDVSGIELRINYFQDPIILISIVLIFLIVGLLSGSYPAFFLSSFAPVTVLRGKVQTAMKSGSLRKVLVVIQFGISIALVIGTLVILKQLNYIQNYELGFDKEQVLIVQDAYALGDNLESFKNELLNFPEVKAASISSFLPVSQSARSDNAFWPEGTDFNTETSVSLQNWRVDEDYLESMGMELQLGRNFSEDRPTDTAAVILNERAVELFGFENPIGSYIQTVNLTPDGNPDFQNTLKFEVIGVVQDFNYDSFESNINALGLFNLPSSGFISIKLTGNNILNSVQNVEEKWESMVDDQPFSYVFLDDRFNEMYQNESRVAKLVGLFAGLAIFIACLGLFALAAFTAEQRTEEIGVRKVMGASVWDIVLLMSKEFNKLVLISFIIAAPLAWYGMEKWLEDFAYRTNIGVSILLIAGLLSFLIAWITMSYQSVKAGTSDPIKSLRYE
jgi:putative ABC transport system permease protein